jgi:hypothetical protein
VFAPLGVSHIVCGTSRTCQVTVSSVAVRQMQHLGAATVNVGAQPIPKEATGVPGACKHSTQAAVAVQHCWDKYCSEAGHDLRAIMWCTYPLQYTWAQVVMHGRVGGLRQIGHSASSPSACMFREKCV